MLGKVKVMQERQEGEIAAVKDRVLGSSEAHDLMAERSAGGSSPRPSSPRCSRPGDTPRHPEFAARAAWSLLNAFTEVLKTWSARAQVKDSLKLMTLFRFASAE